jgi:putative flippase GtrA
VEIAIGVGQIFNFITQRKFAFKSDSSVWIAAMWYLIAYVLITFGCAAVQGLYKAALYNQLINTMGMGKGGETLADVLTMIINAFISYIVFYPILKIIFKDKKKQ